MICLFLLLVVGRCSVFCDANSGTIKGVFVGFEASSLACSNHAEEDRSIYKRLPDSFGSIHFDDPSTNGGPGICTFLSSPAPTTSQFTSLGVTFSSSNPTNWRMLDQCSNFGVSGFSAPAFLAYNAGSGVATLTLQFTSSVSSISISCGSTSAGTITLTCSSSVGFVGQASTSLSTGALQPLSVIGSINSCIISTTRATVVCDDLVFAASLIGNE
jgi:hypothetical protein